MAKCKECKKVLSVYNKGVYCFTCAGSCTIRDDELVVNAKLCIVSAENYLKLLTSPERIAKEILKYKKIIAKKTKLIDKIKKYVKCIVDTDPVEDIEI